jgi:hypothetical protein
MAPRIGIINSSKRVLREDQGLSYWERGKVKDVMDEALGSYLRGKKFKAISNERR